MLVPHDYRSKILSALAQTGLPATLATLYDMVSTVAYPRLMSRMAMKHGSKYKLNEVMG